MPDQDNYAWGDKNFSRLVHAAKAGRIDTKDQALAGEMLDYYRKACDRYEKVVHEFFH